MSSLHTHTNAHTDTQTGAALILVLYCITGAGPWTKVCRGREREMNLLWLLRWTQLFNTVLLFRRLLFSHCLGFCTFTKTIYKVWKKKISRLCATLNNWWIVYFLTHSKGGCGFDQGGCQHSLWSLRDLPVSLWVLSGLCNLVSPFKNMHACERVGLFLTLHCHKLVNKCES